MRPLLSAALAGIMAACGAGEPPGPPASSVREMESPAAEGSGEPHLSSGGDAVYLTWHQKATDGGHEVRLARLGPEGWSEPVSVARGRDFFVNWADFPSVTRDAGGRLWVHWLEREASEGLAYGVRITRSEDGGTTWSEPWTPHEDGTRTEHGFVTLFPWQDGVGVVWLDGRKYAPGPAGAAPTDEMTVRFRWTGGAGGHGDEVVLDGRACDCCQTDVALTAEGPVAVYRDRTAGEVRDIHVTRWTPEGWTEGQPVHADGWVIAACPVNGPAVSAEGSRVAVAWFTAAQGVPKVLVAVSEDAGRTFGPPVRVDGGDPAGRVDVRIGPGGSARVSWLERTGADGAELRLAVLAPDASPPRTTVVASTSSARASGFPRLAIPPWSPTSTLVAWTDVSAQGRPRVRVTLVEGPR